MIFNIILLLINTKSYIILPFKTRELEIKMTDDYMKQIFFNDIYINLTIGSEKQIVPINIKMNSNSFYILDEKYNKTNNPKYSASKSKTLIHKENINAILLEEDFTEGKLITDKIIFNGKNIINNFKFILIDSLIFGIHLTDAGVIGFEIPKAQKILSKSIFMENLKNSSLIEKRAFSIIYNNNKKDEGYFIVGDEVYNIDESDYVENALKLTNCISIYNDIYWGFTIDNFNSNGTFLERIQNVLFYNELGVIIGNYVYRGYIKKNFFENYSDLCEEKQFYSFGNHDRNFDSFYFYYICREDFNEKNFPTIRFENKKMNLTFELDYNDLFVTYNNNKYFLIIFPEELFVDKHFIFGKPFFKKYDMTFYTDSKKIGVYDKGVKKYNKLWNKIWYIIKILIIILLFCVITLIIYAFYIKLHAPRKRRIYEIEDDFDYVPDKKTLLLK